MEDLVFIHDLKSEPYTTVDVLVHHTKTSRHAVMQLISTHKNKLEKFGVMAFEMRKPVKGSKGGHPRKEWLLNEPQATLLMTMLDNTPVVAEFKLNLVKAFYELREEITKQRVMLERNRKTNKDLGQVIHDYLPDNPYAYSNYHTLAYKTVTGFTPKQLRGMFHVEDAQDALTSEQLEQIELIRQVIAGLIMIGQDYRTIQRAISKGA
ncbi:Rha family transcriptional regulator [Weissella paramesenteroides]|uniref:Rha family transcriptional regulator n=1 Tax=Weissella paramesenteroides TaxID=1249 RepID=UPI002E7C557A|nr:Rha family transcriptional regulator [Weissella paramesenteroides]WPQ68521.1 Rha family transcriptional regulator [Weissella paramesenteroides]